MGNLAEPKTLHTVSQWEFLMTKNAAAQKRLFGKNETWYVGLSCQYKHFMSFSSKSEHDIVADQATFTVFKIVIFTKVRYGSVPCNAD